jgi:putative hemolysin
VIVNRRLSRAGLLHAALRARHGLVPRPARVQRAEPAPALSVSPSTNIIDRKDTVTGRFGGYSARLASCEQGQIEASRLRFRVFNLELGEGLSTSFSTGLDTDPFDAVCDHLLVENDCGQVVGTYRMQSGITALTNLGYYSAQEFDFAPFEQIRLQTLELGRACIDRNHRSSEVLTLLWRGIAQYARLFGLRFLIGCSSLNSQAPEEGWRVYRQLAGSALAQEQFRTVPLRAYELPGEDPVFSSDAPPSPVQIPKLLRTYLGIGAKVCGPPAWDRDFGTIDFLTLMDLNEMSPGARSRFLAD